MPIFRENDTVVTSEALTDVNGDPITTGTVTCKILSEDRQTEYGAETNMAHTTGGVWQVVFESSSLTLPTSAEWGIVVIAVGTEPDATYERVEPIMRRGRGQ